MIDSSIAIEEEKRRIVRSHEERSLVPNRFATSFNKREDSPEAYPDVKTSEGDLRARERRDVQNQKRAQTFRELCIGATYRPLGPKA